MQNSNANTNQSTNFNNNLGQTENRSENMNENINKKLELKDMSNSEQETVNNSEIKNYDLNTINLSDLSDLNPEQLKTIEQKIREERKSKAMKNLVEHWDAFVKASKDADLTIEDAITQCNPSILKSGKKTTKIKYRNPDNPSETWSGKGRPPKFYKEYVDNGGDPKNLLV